MPTPGSCSIIPSTPLFLGATMRSLSVSIVGATGAVGVEFLDLLAKRDFPVGRLRLFGSARSAGTRVPWRGGEIEVEDLGCG